MSRLLRGPRGPRALVLGAVGLAVVLLATLGGPNSPETAHGCAFLRTPGTYEADGSRASYLAALDAASVDAIFPGDPFFGLPLIESGTRTNRIEGPSRQVPPTLLRAIAWVESGLTMASRSVPFQSTGDALVSFDCGHGLMQITTGMTLPLGSNSQPSGQQVSVATHYVYNAARGANILAEKWNQAPQLRPIAGTDTNGDPGVIENWYFAVWSYNGFTGPGANQSNHPLDPSFAAWPREAYRCDGSQSRARYPYQEMVWGCLANPPVREGQVLWNPVPASAPDLRLPQYFQPLSITNFRFPFAGMDMPTPQPAHVDTAPTVDPNFRARVLAAPKLAVTAATTTLRLGGNPEQARTTIRVSNAGTGILSWTALPSDGWLVVDPPAGVALGGEVSCSNTGCERIAEITVTVNPVQLPAASTSGSIIISSPNAPEPDILLRINVSADFEVGAPGTSRAN